MQVQKLVVIGDPLKCWRCKAPASVMLCRDEGEERTLQINYCDTCWIGETRAYSPMVQRDEQSAVSAAEHLIAGDDEQKAGAKT